MGMINYSASLGLGKAYRVYNLDAGLEAPTFVISLYSNLAVLACILLG